jgi:uncharacterized membrane protein YfhO
MNDFDDDVTYSTYSKYNNALATLRPVVDTIEKNDKSFYRTEKNYHRKTNDPMALGTKGLSLSTSTLNKDTTVYLQKMGYSSKSNWSKYLGGTPVNDSILGIKYLISEYDWTQYYGDPIYTPKDYEYSEGLKTIGDYDVYLNPYALSLAFGVSDEYADFDMSAYDNPFDRLNALVTSMLGESETVNIFVPAEMSPDFSTTNLKHEHIDASRTADKIDEEKYIAIDNDKDAYLTYTYTVPTDTQLYYYNPTGYTREVKLKANSITTEPVTALKLGFAGNETNRIINLGTFSTPNLSLRITLNSDSHNFYTRERDSYVYYVDMEVFKDAFARLAKTQLIIDEGYSDDDLTGKISTDVDGQLIFTSIPYDEGWNVYVDGNKVEIFETSDALVSFRINAAGDHEVRLKYMPATIMLGIIVTTASTILFVAILAAYPFLKRLPLFRNKVLIGGKEIEALPTAEDNAPLSRGDIGFLEEDERTSPAKDEEETPDRESVSDDNK